MPPSAFAALSEPGPPDMASLDLLTALEALLCADRLRRLQIFSSVWLIDFLIDKAGNLVGLPKVRPGI